MPSPHPPNEQLRPVTHRISRAFLPRPQDRYQTPNQVSHARKFRLIFSASITLSSFALLTTLLHTSMLLLAQQEKHFHFDSNLAQRTSSMPFPPPYHPNHFNSTHPSPPSNYILILDFWERMINVQSGLRRLVQLAVDSNFTIVEPFIFESRVSRPYSFPEHFHLRNMIPQPASLYFRTHSLYMTNHYISHAQFRQHTLLQSHATSLDSHPIVHAQNLTGNHFLIQALVYIQWSPPNHTNVLPFHWCDNLLTQQNLPRTPLGWGLGSNFHVQRAICLNSAATVAPAKFGPRLFHNLFVYARQGTVQYPQKCIHCTTLAFINYRKHAFTGFVAPSGAMPFKQKAPPLEVGTIPQALADRIRSELLGGRPYVAIQLRTGKAYALFERYDRKLLSQGHNVTRYESFRNWMASCSSRLVRQARKTARGLGSRSVFYIASDMYNDGWKGGEKCPQQVASVLEETKAYLNRELGGVKWFDPRKFGITQDAMGISGIADAAVCLKADRFMFAVPSNFGRWVHEQRSSVREASSTVKVDCMDKKFDRTQVST